MCTVVNRRVEQFDVYIGRGTGGKPGKWGNPFKNGTKEQNIVNYRMHLWEKMQSGEISEDDLLELDGKKLGCWCKPSACHGDIIAAAVAWVKAKG